MAKMSGMRDRVAALEAAVHDLQEAIEALIHIAQPVESVEGSEPVEPAETPARRRGSRGR